MGHLSLYISRDTKLDAPRDRALIISDLAPSLSNTLLCSNVHMYVAYVFLRLCGGNFICCIIWDACERRLEKDLSNEDISILPFNLHYDHLFHSTFVSK